MYVFLTVALCLFSISFHELGHAWANYTCRVPIREISLLGIKFPFVPSFRTGIRIPGQRMPTLVVAHLFIVGAYVVPEGYAFRRLGARDQAFIYGAGPFASFLYGLLMLSVGVLLQLETFRWWVLPALLGMIAVMIIFRKIFCRYIVLAIGITLLGLLIYSMVSMPDAGNSMGGPVTIVQQGSQEYMKQAAQNNELRTAFNLAALLSFALGTTNALPLVSLDGGGMVKSYLSKLNVKAGSYFGMASGFVFLILIYFALSNDLGILWRMLSR